MGTMNIVGQPMFRKSFLATAVTLFICPVAYGQTDGGPATLDEITVTARKVEESMQDVPVAVSALDGDFIKELNLKSPTDVLDFIPGATYLHSNPGEQVFSLRGISSGAEGASSDAGVLVMVDNEVVSRDFMRSAAMFDVQRVEVLRGPQGTTYGRNATGGVVHVLNNTPSENNEGGITLHTGNYGYGALEGFINGQLGETTAGRLSLQYTDRDGYSENAITGASIDDWTTTALRGQLLFEPSDNLSVLIRAHWTDEESSGNPTAKKAYDPTLPVNFRFDPGAADYMEPSSDPWIVENSQNTSYTRQVSGLSSEIVWNLESLNVTSITAYRDADDDADVDLFGTPRDMVVQRSDNDATTWSQELRVDNVGSHSPIAWQAGLFYLNEDHNRNERKDILIGVVAINPVIPLLAPGELWDTSQDFTQSNETDSLGIFGEAQFSLGDDTDLSIGARYSSDEKTYATTHAAAGPLSIIFLEDPSEIVVAGVSEDWSATTGKIALTHRLSDSNMVYASAATGYKSGGFNPEPFNVEAAITPFDEETVQSIEVGSKNQWLDNRLRLNATAFYSEYDDIQAEFFNPSGVTIIANIAAASITGVELEFTWLLTDNFTLLGSYAGYDHEYDEFIDADGNDLSGNKLQNVPDWTANVSADYQIPLDSGSAVKLRLDYRIRSDIFDDADPDPVQGIRQGEDMLHARATWYSADSKWEVSAWGKNLLDNAEIVNIGTRSIMSQRRVIYAAPRTYGVSFTYNWM
jgi:iron complex outermembrane receptor protein